MIKKTHFLGLLTATILAGTTAVQAETRLTIATVNNGDMIVMQKLSPKFEQANPDIKLDWVVLEENVLRQRVTTDIATKGGQYDVMTIGTYEVPIWAKQGWIKKFDKLPATYDVRACLSRTSWCTVVSINIALSKTIARVLDPACRDCSPARLKII